MGMKDIAEEPKRLSATYREVCYTLPQQAPVTEEMALIVALIFDRDPETVLADLHRRVPE